ncbi:MAG: HAD family hydrolase [Limnochordales bacterium]|nr:HAD family hydrolase [Limnochordales bacterium]
MPDARLPEVLLLDLDGTLLDLDFDRIIPDYLALLHPYFAAHLGFDEFARLFVQATAEMLKPVDWPLPPGTPTNGERFYNAFSRLTGIAKQSLRSVTEQFYREAFPRLRHKSAPLPEARELLAAARAQGWRLVLATQPIFPMVALLERLSWAGISPTAFELITYMDTFHATKPHPAYFYEVCQRLRVTPEQCIMVGNDVHDDMPARRVGIKTFLVDTFLLHPEAATEECTPNGRGSLQDLIALVKSGELARV